MAKKNVITEEDVIKHVQKYGRYEPSLKKTPYWVDWCGKGYAADDTRAIAVFLLRNSGIRVLKE